MTKRKKKTKVQAIIHKTLHRKLKIEQQEPHFRGSENRCFGRVLFHTVGTVLKSEIGITNTPNTQIYDHSFSWLGTGTSIKSELCVIISINNIHQYSCNNPFFINILCILLYLTGILNYLKYSYLN
jgi:hypothetical protein